MNRVKLWILALIGLAVAGIVGNRFDAGFVRAYEEVQVLLAGLPWYVSSPILLLALGGLGFALAWSWRGDETQSLERRITDVQQQFQSVLDEHREISQEIDDSLQRLRKYDVIVGGTRTSRGIRGVGDVAKEMERVVELDNVIFRLLPRLFDESHDQEGSLHQFIRLVFDHISELFEFPVRIAVLIPKDGFLKPLVTQNLTYSAMERVAFDIRTETDDVPKARGIAGTAFLQKQIRIAHIGTSKGRWQSDDPTYVPLEGSHDRLFKSVAAIPLFLDDETPVGVLSVDSHKSSAFDKADMQALLQALASRIAVVITLHEHSRSLINPG